MTFQPSLLPPLLVAVLMLAACGEPEFEPVVVAGDPVEPLPAPLPAAGPVTGPGEARLSETTLPADVPPAPDALTPALLPVITPVPGSDPSMPAAGAGEQGSVAVLAFADGPLPPLEDNPEAGLAATPVGHAAPAAAAEAGVPPAAAAVRAYYDAVQAGDLARAYAAWSDGGRASGRSPEQFAAGMEGLEVLSVSIGETGRVEGAAGSRYVEVPVTVTSRGSDGRELRQVGAFVMRSSQVEGAAPGWYISSAELRELRP